MKTDIDSLETKFFVISEDLNYKEVSNLDDATNVRPKPYLIVRKDIIGKTKSIYDNGHYAHSRYIFFNDSSDSRTECYSTCITFKVISRILTYFSRGFFNSFRG